MVVVYLGNVVKMPVSMVLCMMISRVEDEGFDGFYIEHRKCLEYSRGVQSHDCEVIVG